MYRLYFLLLGSFFSGGIYAQTCSPCALLRSQPGVIFCDDFEDDAPLDQRYFGYDNDEGEFIRLKGVGREGSYGMRVRFQKGEVGAGVLQKAIGASPDPKMRFSSSPTEKFTEIYWRMDLKHQPGWEGGGGDKLSRATVIASKTWQQGLIAHVWSGGRAPQSNFLVIDPASGIDTGSQLASTKYNDFERLRWLGGKQGKTPLFQSDHTGKWYCIVAHVKINTPGKNDGVFELWIDGQLEQSITDLNWHGHWQHYGINAVFFENYWNKGSVKEQERYMDNIVISTQPIFSGCQGQQ